MLDNFLAGFLGELLPVSSAFGSILLGRSKEMLGCLTFGQGLHHHAARYLQSAAKHHPRRDIFCHISVRRRCLASTKLEQVLSFLDRWLFRPDSSPLSSPHNPVLGLLGHAHTLFDSLGSIFDALSDSGQRTVEGPLWVRPGVLDLCLRFLLRGMDSVANGCGSHLFDLLPRGIDLLITGGGLRLGLFLRFPVLLLAGLYAPAQRCVQALECRRLAIVLEWGMLPCRALHPSIDLMKISGL